MRYRWFRWWTVFTVPFVAGPFVVGGMLFVEAYDDNWEKALGLLPLLAFSIILSYSSVALLFNSTEVAVEDDLVTVRHGPIPWKGRAYRMVECERFFADKLQVGRVHPDGVRIQFSDETYENLTVAKSAEQAQEWAERLNQELATLRESSQGSSSEP